MPSPFPGMDPYLEGELWSNFHSQLAVEIARNLIPKLVPRYVAVTEKYQYVVGPEEIGITLGPESVIPDVTVSRSSSRAMAKAAARATVAPLTLDTVVSIPINHVWVKILDLSNRLLVTAIEFLSPTNKKGHGRRKYLKKRRRLLLSQAHLMGIDLLRSGHRVPMADPLPDAAYFIFLCRAGQRPATQVWPITLDQALPIVKVPLLKGDPDVELNLQQVFDAVYDLGGMAYLIDYGKPPDVPLGPDWAGWADDLLRAAGMRSRRRERRS
jgi:Protein of unknown function (DUF4058)